MIFTDNIKMINLPVANESFVYTGSIGEPFFVEVYSHYHKLADLMIEPGTIWMTGNAPKFDSITIRGSRSDSIMKAYLAMDEKLVDSAWELKACYDSLRKAKNVKLATEVGRQCNSVAVTARKQLIKHYVKTYQSEIVGALLLNFCTLEDILTKEDYCEMYYILNPAVKNSGYGRSILERCE